MEWQNYGKKGHQGVIGQLCSLDVKASKPYISLDLQRVIDNHSKVFVDIPKGIPPAWDHYHAIHLIPRSVSPNIKPCRYPYAQKSEIECMFEEMLEAGIIQHSQIFFSQIMVMVHKKDDSWHICLDYREIDKINIKDKFPIDESLDELHGEVYFTKLDLCLGYHKIIMKEGDIPKIKLKV